MAALPSASSAAAASFRFVHFTDTHIQPELRAEAGVRQAFAAINSVPHAFCIAGGDLVMDVYEQGPARAKTLFDLYTGAVKDLRQKVYSIPGNHDVFGVHPKAGVSAADPLYGKKMFEDRIGPRYQSFDYQGWHFILLDSIAIDGQGQWFGGFDDAQLEWLQADLARVGPTVPLVVATHIPIATAMGTAVFDPGLERFLVVRQPQRILPLFRGKNLKAVLQGHTHIREVVHYEGSQWITTGAVCGNWWKGAHHGHPEGFAVLTVRGETIQWEYRTYGWKAST